MIFKTLFDLILKIEIHEQGPIKSLIHYHKSVSSAVNREEKINKKNLTDSFDSVRGSVDRGTRRLSVYPLSNAPRVTVVKRLSFKTWRGSEID